MKAKTGLALAAAIVGTIYLTPLAAGVGNARAASNPDTTEQYEHDHEEAFKARASGDILPYAEILKKVQDRIHGDIVETEIEQEKGVWIYEIKFVSPTARLVKLYVNATTGAVIRVEGNH